MPFVFYDTETTGLHPGFDQIVQVAAIRTDNDLNETDRFELRSRINPNVVPSAQAILANGLSIGELTDQRLPSHYQMICELNRRFESWSPAIFLGYNSIRFDEEFLRQALYQTLNPPYLTSFHGNGRNDVMSLALACSASGASALSVPLNETGRASFKLQDLATANGVSPRKAHDALSDTETALELCRHVKRLNPDLWQRFVRFSNKAAVADFASSDEPFLLTEFFANKAYHTPVVFVANEPEQANSILCLNLSTSVADLASMSDEQLAAKVSSKPSPLRRVRTNAGPVLMPLWETSDELLGGLSCEELEDRAKQIIEDHSFRARLAELFSKSRRKYPEPTHVEEKLYSGFSSSSDVTLCNRFHAASWDERLEIARSFEDDRLQELAERIIYSNCRSSLPSAIVQKMDVDLANRLMSSDARLPSVVQAIREIEEELASSEDNASNLEEYAAYLVERRAKIKEFLQTL